MSRDEHAALRKKFEELEREVKRLKEPLESTLMDVRELIANLENPFNFASSILGDLEKPLAEKKPSSNDNDGQKQASPRRIRENHVSSEEHIEEFSSHGRYDADLGEGIHKTRLRRGRYDELAVIGCAYMLLRTLGLNATVKFLNSRAARKFASPELLDMLLDAVEFIVSLNTMMEPHGGKGRKNLEELMVAAAYLVSMLASGADDKFFTSLVLASKILDLKLRED